MSLKDFVIISGIGKFHSTKPLQVKAPIAQFTR